MKRYLLVLVFAAFSVGASNATSTYTLSIPEVYETEAYVADLEKWKKSLIDGVGYSEENITQGIFLRTDIPITKDGKRLVGTVYRKLSDSNQFFESNSRTIIDFHNKLVGTMGVAGISVHPTPSGRMVVILAPTKGLTLLGVTLDFTGKVSVEAPRFKQNKVTFEW